MAETESDLYGWDLMFTLYRRQMTTKMNVVIVWSHFNLLRRGMKNCGYGQYASLPAPRELRETLPMGWNDNQPCHMRYFFQKKIYLLAIQAPDDNGDIIINLTRACDLRVTVTIMNLREIILMPGRLDQILPRWPAILRRINQELINPMLRHEVARDMEVQTDPSEEGREGYPPVVYHTPADIPLPPPPTFNFVPPVGAGVGSADLNPLGGGGGMIFQPPGMGPRPFMPDPYLPPGSLPPGARFDPIMPGAPGNFRPMPNGSRPRPMPRREYPDPDHLPPPGSDDMFS